jgi:hypothetical protein
MRTNVCISLCAMSALTCVASITNAQTDMGSNTQLVNAAKGICSATGVATDVSFDASGNATVPLGKAGLSGAAHFSRAQWDGIVAMQRDPGKYVECLQVTLPFLSRN